MNNFRQTKIPGVFEIDFFHLSDDRGVFVKTFHRGALQQEQLEQDFAESFYSVNNKNVLRGMHFQYPPDDHAKIVYCTHGKLLDVVVDIRRGSPAFGQYIAVELSGKNYKGMYLPRGTAHGFLTLENDTCMVYLTSTVHSPKNDSGILWNSFGYKWPVKFPIHSQRDLEFLPLQNFETPFIWS